MVETEKDNTLWKLFFILMLVFCVGLVIFITSIPNKSSPTGNVILRDSPLTTLKDSSPTTCEDIQVPYQETEYYWERVPYADRECETKNLQYSKTNDAWDYSTCAKWEKKCDSCWYGPCNCEDFCSEKKLSYSADINNQDDEGGNWKLAINFYLEGEIYETKEITQYLYPKTTKTFTGTHIVYGDSPNGDANKRVSGANAIAIYIPTKQVCRDVTKYEDVQRSRIVTKYKTEKVCN